MLSPASEAHLVKSAAHLFQRACSSTAIADSSSSTACEMQVDWRSDIWREHPPFARAVDSMDMVLDRGWKRTKKPQPIPRHIVQTGPSNQRTWVNAFRESYGSWQRWHPDWSHTFWNDSATGGTPPRDNPNMEAFVQRFFPFFLPAWRRLCHRVMKFDVARYMWLYVYGGVYVDLDVAAVRSVAPILDGARLVLVGDDPRHTSQLNCSGAALARTAAASTHLPTADTSRLKDTTLETQDCGPHFGNYLMAAEPRHPLFVLLLRYVADNVEGVCSRFETQMKPRERATAVLELTGPLALGRNFLVWCHYAQQFQAPLHVAGARAHTPAPLSAHGPAHGPAHVPAQSAARAPSHATVHASARTSAHTPVNKTAHEPAPAAAHGGGCARAELGVRLLEPRNFSGDEFEATPVPPEYAVAHMRRAHSWLKRGKAGVHFRI